MKIYSSNENRKILSQTCVVAVGLLTLIQTSEALPFVAKQADLFLGFRKTGADQEANEVVVNLGQATNFVNLTIGTVTNLTGLVASQLSPDSFTSLDNLTWSAFGLVNNNVYPGYPRNTIWVTLPRSDVNTKSDAPARPDQDLLNSTTTPMKGVIDGAVAISGRISANQDNTASFVREPISNSSIVQGQNVGVYIGGTIDPSLGTFQDSLPYNVENTTPDTGSFTSALRSDLYEVRPDGFTDPHTGQTSGSTYYIGYFQLNVNGTMTFTRAAATTTPPAPNLSISRSGNVSTISFTSANSATYTLYFTNSTGLLTPVASWPSKPATITGDGLVKSFSDTTTDSDRVYRVTAQ